METVCIYCLQLGPGTGEHVVPRLLGGNVEIQDVCGKCNSLLSVVDQHIGEHGLTALDRQAHTPNARLAGAHYVYDQDGGVVIELSVRDQEAKPLPQVHALGGGNFYVCAHDAEDYGRLDAFITDQIHQGTLRDARRRETSEASGSSTRLVLFRKDRAFIRASSQAEGDQFLEELIAGWEKMRSKGQSSMVHSLEQPGDVMSQMTFSVDKVFRGAAKMAFNTLALKRGADFVRDEVFNDVRKYIIGRDVRRQRTHEGLEYDPRFVSWEQLSASSRPNHLIAVRGWASTGRVEAIVVLYGAIRYRVRLGRLRECANFLHLHQFSADRTENRALEDVAALLWPDAVNLQGT